MGNNMTTVQLCRDSVCFSVNVRQVSRFSDLPRGQDILLLVNQLGEFSPGIYVLRNSRWVFVLRYEDFINARESRATVNIYIGLSAPKSVGVNETPYYGGFPAAVSTLTPQENRIWAVITAAASVASPPVGGQVPSPQTYSKVVIVAAQEWTVDHMFGRYPHIQVLSSGGIEVTAEIIHTNLNQSRVRFSQSQTGMVIAT